MRKNGNQTRSSVLVLKGGPWIVTLNISTFYLLGRSLLVVCLSVLSRLLFCCWRTLVPSPSLLLLSPGNPGNACKPPHNKGKTTSHPIWFMRRNWIIILCWKNIYLIPDLWRFSLWLDAAIFKSDPSLVLFSYIFVSNSIIFTIWISELWLSAQVRCLQSQFIQQDTTSTTVTGTCSIRELITRTPPFKSLELPSTENGRMATQLHYYHPHLSYGLC